MTAEKITKTREAEIIQTLMSMDEQSIRRVIQTMAAYIDGSNEVVPAASSPDVYEEPDEFESVKLVLQYLSNKSDFQKIEAIDALLREVQNVDAKIILERTRSEIINSDMSLAVRVAVTRYTAESPFMVVGAIAGLLLGAFVLIQAVRSAFN